MAGALLIGFGASGCEPPPEVEGPANVDRTLPDGGLTSLPGQPLRTEPTTFTVVALPDTQIYAAQFPAIFKAQTEWIIGQRRLDNLAFVLHEGDIVDNDVEAQWTPAAASLHQLDGIVPYVLSAGNHDFLGDGWAANRVTLIDAYFPISTFTGASWFKGTFEPEHIENNFELFDVPGAGRWLVISLEFGPRDVVLAWANAIAKLYATTPAIVVTHAYLYDDDTRYDRASGRVQRWNPHSYPIAVAPGDVNDGEEIWQKLILRNSNIQFVFCGHVMDRGVGRRLDVRPDGTTVVQILANYQMLPQGGGGYLRAMEISPLARWIHVRTYSPFLDAYKSDPDNDFFMDY